MLPLVDLFREPGIADASLAVVSPEDSAALAAVKKCFGICNETSNCMKRQGESDRHCIDLFLNSRACLAQFVSRSAFDALIKCSKEKSSYSECASELISVHKATEKALDALDEATVLNPDEASAVANCGSVTQAKSRNHLNMILGCSMSHVCLAELDALGQCWLEKEGDLSKCVTEGRALMTAFRPYMEKMWIKDKQFMIRGVKNLTFFQM